MASIGKVSAVFTASTGGLQSGVDAAVKAFRAMGGDAGSLRSSLASLGAAGAQMTEQVSRLAADFLSGSVSAREFSASMSGLAAAVDLAAKAKSDAVAVTRELASAESEYFAKLDQIKNAVTNGGLAEGIAAQARREAYSSYLAAAAAADQEAAAVSRLQGVVSSLAQSDVSLDLGSVADGLLAELDAIGPAAAPVDVLAGIFDESAIAMRLAEQEAAALAPAIDALSSSHARGAAIARQNMTAEERLAEQVAELTSLLNAGAISQETFDRAVASATPKIASAASAASTMDSGLAGVASRLNVLIGLNVAQLFGSIASSVSRSVGSLVSMGKAEADVIDKTSKMAERFGLTYGEMAGLSVAANRAGVDLDTVGDAAQKADIAFAKAAQGSAGAVSAFKAIGLSASDLDGLSTAQRFEEIAGAIASLPTQAERAAAAVAIFGRSGADLLPLFAQGAEGIARTREEAERLGLTLTNAQGQDVRTMKDSFDSVRDAVSGVVQQVVAYLAPAVTEISSAFVALVGSIGGANIGQSIGQGILQGATYLASVGDYLIANFGSTFSYLSQVGQQWAAALGVGRVIANLFYGTFKVFESVGNGVGILLAKIAEKLLSAAATLTSVLPGYERQNANLQTAALNMSTWADIALGTMSKNMQAAGEAFGNAFTGTASSEASAVSGPLVASLNAAADKAKNSAAAVDAVTKNPVAITQAVEVDVKEAIKGIDSRSKEGVAEMFRIIRGDTGNVAQEQLTALQQIAQNTADLEPTDALILPGA
jgi:hypothetical protein